MRGIAALVVVFYHSSIAFPGVAEARARLLFDGLAAPYGWAYLSPLGLLLAGPVAVYVFFVLSGLVLAITFVERGGERYLPFITKRVTRVWIPFAVAAICSAALKYLIGWSELQQASGWFNMTNWNTPLTPALLAHTLLMTGRDISLDNPMWSLVHEMRISLIFPLVVWLTMRNWRVSLGATATLSLACAGTIGQFPIGSWTVSFLQTLSYLVMFVVGICIAMHSRPLRTWLRARPKWVHGLLWVLALTGFIATPATGYVSHLWEGMLMLLNTLAAGTVLILAIVEGRAMTILLGHTATYLGRISYSLYLTHVPVIVAVVRVTNGTLPLLASVTLGAVAALVVATAFQSFVERPTMRLGRRLATRLS